MCDYVRQAAKFPSEVAQLSKSFSIIVAASPLLSPLCAFFRLRSSLFSHPSHSISIYPPYLTTTNTTTFTARASSGCKNNRRLLHQQQPASHLLTIGTPARRPAVLIRLLSHHITSSLHTSRHLVISHRLTLISQCIYYPRPNTCTITTGSPPSPTTPATGDAGQHTHAHALARAAQPHPRPHPTLPLFLFFYFYPMPPFHSISHSSTPCPLPISTPESSLSHRLPPALSSPSSLPLPRSRLCRLVSLPGDGIMKNAPIDRAPQLRLAEMGHDRPRSILIPSYNVSTNESISAKFSIFQKPTRETGISSFVKILLSISSAI